MAISEEIWEVLILVGICLPIGLVGGMLVRRKFPKRARDYQEYSQSVRWPYFAVGAAFFFFLAAMRRDHLGFLALFASFGAMQVVAMLSSIWRHRSQWSIGMLLALTLLVAVSCSLFSWWGVLICVGTRLKFSGEQEIWRCQREGKHQPRI